jgi:hypothetical protein
MMLLPDPNALPRAGATFETRSARPGASRRRAPPRHPRSATSRRETWSRSLGRAPARSAMAPNLSGPRERLTTGLVSHSGFIDGRPTLINALGTRCPGSSLVFDDSMLGP